MTPFEYALSLTLHHEGGFVDNVNDPGGATYRGVSLRFLRAAGIDVNGDGDIDLKDIRALQVDRTQDMLNTIYFNNFWKPNRLREVRSELLNCKIFDMAVNMGSRQAWKIVQRAGGLVVDGIVGPNTIAYVKKQRSTDYEFLAKIRFEQSAFYARLIAQKPLLAQFKRGWFRRAAQ